MPEAFFWYAAATFVGMALRALQRWGDGETRCVTDYFLSEFPQHTVSAMVVNLMAVATAFADGTMVHTSILHAIVVGLLQGYAVDAALNKSKRVTWSGEERQRKLRR